jgi:hypothetical protein
MNFKPFLLPQKSLGKTCFAPQNKSLLLLAKSLGKTAFDKAEANETLLY